MAMASTSGEVVPGAGMCASCSALHWPTPRSNCQANDSFPGGGVPTPGGQYWDRTPTTQGDPETNWQLSTIGTLTKKSD